MVCVAYGEIVESCYEKPTEFIPERWGEKPEMVRDKSVFVPFSIGECFFKFSASSLNLEIDVPRSV